MKIITIIQARTGSSRLPGKTLMPLAGKTVLARMVERVLASQLAGETVVATTTEKEDDAIEQLCIKENFKYYRGHPTDLLDRHYSAALFYGADAVVKIPSDCPLISASVVDKVLKYYLMHQDKFDYVSNLHPATYPDGNDVEIMPMEILEIAHRQAKKNFEREHTTPYIWENPARFRIGNVEWETGLDFSMSQRWTLDYIEDYNFIKRVYEELYPKNPEFDLRDIIRLLAEKEELLDINSKYAGVNWYRNHLTELKTVGVSQTKLMDLKLQNRANI
ncbi:MAG TPA: glycosyltransferase family protein [Ignavibacteriales bacterium]|nr:glycosyltransferase family protein [Ignavibacteriales bacterium]